MFEKIMLNRVFIEYFHYTCFYKSNFNKTAIVCNLAASKSTKCLL